MLEIIKFLDFEFKLKEFGNESSVVNKRNENDIIYHDSEAFLSLIYYKNVSPRIVLKSWIGNHLICRFFEDVAEDKVEEFLLDNSKIIIESLHSYLVFRDYEVRHENLRIKDKFLKYEILI